MQADLVVLLEHMPRIMLVMKTVASHRTKQLHGFPALKRPAGRRRAYGFDRRDPPPPCLASNSLQNDQEEPRKISLNAPADREETATETVKPEQECLQFESSRAGTGVDVSEQPRFSCREMRPTTVGRGRHVDGTEPEQRDNVPLQAIALPDLLFLFSFSCSTDHERDWLPGKIIYRVGNNTLNVRNNNIIVCKIPDKTSKHQNLPLLAELPSCD